MATIFRHNGALVVASDAPLTFECSADGLKFYRSIAGQLMVGTEKKPASVQLNGKNVKDFQYDPARKAVILPVPAGEGTVVLQ